MTLILIITLIVYIGMIFFAKHRTSIAFIGAGLLLILGSVSSYFDVNAAFLKFPSEIIILIIVLALFTDLFERVGLINYIGYKFISFSKENRIIIMITIPLIVYFMSLWMNNLTVVLLFTYMALYLCMEYKLPIIPVLVSVVIGSNIGGAPLPWADTPAVILTLYTNFNLADFLTKLFIPCLVYVILLAGYTYMYYKHFTPNKELKREIPFKKKPPVRWHEARLPMIVFVLYIIAVSVGPFIGISIAYISLLFGGILLIIDKPDPMDTLNKLPIMDSIAFIIALFLIVGILEYSGILKIAAEYIIGLTNNNPYLILLSVLFIAFIIATFLSAGPAAATLLPICAVLAPLIPFKLIYAALALGVLAGSSMLPWSATGGPILLSQVNRFAKRPHVPKPEKDRINVIFNLKEYLKFSIPFSLIILCLSALYLSAYLKILS